MTTSGGDWQRPTWVLADGVVSLADVDGSVVAPPAAIVYAAQFGSGQPDYTPQPVSRPSDDLPSLHFTRFPADVHLVVEPSDDDASPGLRCEVVARCHGRDVTVDSAAVAGVDHFVTDGAWYPVAPGGLDDVRGLLRDARIDQPGEISVGQYIELLRTHRSDPLLIDRCSHSYSHKPAATLPAATPASLGTTLYPYQQTGYTWLLSMAEEGLGCILGDEMGLGKTLQILALVTALRDAGMGPSLVVAPATLLENWRREAARHCPSLSVLIHRGPSRTGLPASLARHDLVVTSYETAVRDLSLLQMLHWQVVALDEAQAIKSPDAKRTLATKSLRRRTGIAVTGTPVENSLTDLWSVTDFAIPGYLGPLSAFAAEYPDSSYHAAVLEPLISPVLLRRRIADVVPDLPTRIEIPQPLELDGAEVQQYEQLRADAAAEARGGLPLGVLMKLRQFCTHPSILGSPDPDPTLRSPKYRRLLEVMEEIGSFGEKVLVFTSFRRMVGLITADLSSRLGIPTHWIDGRVPVPDRVETVERFGLEAGPAALIVNPRAAGTGLNITAANHVVHYNPEWNPAVEDQASARVYRIGQTRPVTIHRFFYIGTVEEVMVERLARKRDLAAAAVVGTDGEAEAKSDILRALQISPVQGNGAL